MLNLTPHAITIRMADGTDRVFPPSGQIARVNTIEEVVGEYDDIPVISRRFGDVTGLPEEGVPCIVSMVVASAVPGRKGVYAPDTGATAIRKDGMVVAVLRLAAA